LPDTLAALSPAHALLRLGRRFAMKEAKNFSRQLKAVPEIVPNHYEKEERSRIIVPSLWMIGLSLLLFFIPVFNGLIAGFVGGLKAGTVKNALLAAILPAIIVAGGLWTLLALLNMPVIGLFAGTAVGLWILLSDVGLFVGA